MLDAELNAPRSMLPLEYSLDARSESPSITLPHQLLIRFFDTLYADAGRTFLDMQTLADTFLDMFSMQTLTHTFP